MNGTDQPLTLAIVDPCCAAGYTPATLDAGGLGGTEATVLRVSSALAPHIDVIHFQKGRETAQRTAVGLMLPLSDAFAPLQDTTFVVINAWKVAVKLRKGHPQARILLWLHIHPGRHNRSMAAALHNAGIEVVCVSQSHATHLRTFLGPDTSLNIHYIYNPIADDLRPDATSRDPDRLFFASSPHKGLSQVFAQFRTAKQTIPSLRLDVADPGYLAWDTGPVPEGVTFLGTLTHAAVIAEMRRSLCLFYPQSTFAETFGIVLAEANAVGTPVLVHRDIGSNAEVVGDAAQLIDGQDVAQIIACLISWRSEAPVIATNAAFRLSAVGDSWMDVLGLRAALADKMDKVA